MSDKLLAVFAYLFWIPALYIVLSEKRREKFVGFHGGQALILWTVIFLIFFAVRLLVNLVWGFFYVPYLEALEILTGAGLYGYALYCGWRCWRGRSFELPR
jgi:uncharacterized membrane protein